MNQSEFKAFAELLGTIADYYRVEMKPATVKLYWHALSAYSTEEIRGALNAHLHNPDTGQFMPKIADVVKLLQGNTLTQAMRAWQKVQRAIGQVGTYQSVVFDDPLIHSVIDDMGGWMQIGLITDDELPFRVREFEKRYQSYRVNPPAEYPRKLAGILEKENSKEGYQVDPPMLLGNQEVARLVFNGGREGIGIEARPLEISAPEMPQLTETV